MNKKTFLKLLEEKLQILSEEERKDIMNEYKDTIEEKVRHGSSEEEAVADFGSMEELSREILKAYKINPDYSKKKEETSKEKVKDIASQSESLIKKGAEKLSEWTKEIFNQVKNSDQNWTLEMVFEILIKAIILLIGLSLLRIPFYWIELLGMSIFEVAFPPLDTIFEILLRLFICILYFALCIIIAIIVFQPYFINQKSPKKKEKRSEKIEEKEINKKEEIKKKTNSGIVFFLKGLLFLCFLFPLYLVDFGCYLATSIILFLLIQGVPVLGIFLLLLSISIFFTFLTRFGYQLLYGGKKVYCYSLILSAVLFASGFFLTLNTISNFQYYQGLPNNVFKKSEVVYQENLSVHDFKIAYWDYRIEENNQLEDDQIEIRVQYYKDFVTDLQNYTTATDDTLFMHFKVYYKHGKMNNQKKLYRMIIDELKENRWYDYHDLADLSITVTANHNTIKKVR